MIVRQDRLTMIARQDRLTMIIRQDRFTVIVALGSLEKIYSLIWSHACIINHLHIELNG